MPNVNTKHILFWLRADKGPLSGEELSQKLGISRVAVWKQIQGLLTAGYGIQVGRKGYHLIQDEGVLPPEFPEIESDVNYWPQLDSTMEKAKEMALNGARHGTLVLAGRQTQGRNLSSLPWSSPPGGLYLTMILRPPLKLAQASVLPLVLGTAMAKELSKCTGEAIQWLWPSGWYSRGIKLGGILPQVMGTPYRLDWVNLGIGFSLLPGTLTPQFPSRRDLVKLTRKIMIDWCNQPDFTSSQWLEGSPLQGGMLIVKPDEGTEWMGKFHGYTPEGNLVILKNQELKVLIYGQNQIQISGE